MHNGGAQKGIAASRTIHGRYSKDLPTRMLANFEAAKSDPELLNLGQEIALVETRLRDVMQRVDTGDTGRIWSDLRGKYADMQRAQREKKTKDIARLLNEMGQLIQSGGADTGAWNEIINLIDTRRKLVESEQKRRIAMRDMVTGEQMQLVIKTLVDSVKRHVNDQRAVAAIADDLSRFFGRPLDRGSD